LQTIGLLQTLPDVRRPNANDGIFGIFAGFSPGHHFVESLPGAMPLKPL
jgi:hypothetical protein